MWSYKCLLCLNLVIEGFSSLEEVLEADLEELSQIEGLNKEFAQEIQEKARETLEEENKQ